MLPELSHQATQVVAMLRQRARDQYRHLVGTQAYRDKIQESEQQIKLFLDACYIAQVSQELPDWAQALLQEANHE